MGLTYKSNKVCPRCGIGGYIWYMDNSEFVAKCTNCNHYFRKDEFSMCVLDKAVKTPVTNADRIRSMIDEQLAVFIAEITDCMFCVAETPIGDEIDGYIRCGNNCEQTILRYLQQEAET